MACIGGEARRIVLWCAWVLNMLVTSIFYCLAFATTASLVRSYKLLNFEISNEVFRGPVAASCLGGLLVLLFNILSCAILIKKSVQKQQPGFGYGFVCAFCFTLAFFCLLCGLVLDGFRETVRDQLAVKLADSWSKLNTGTYFGTIGFAYLCFVMFLLFFFALVIFQGEVSEELGLPAPGTAYGKMAADNNNPYAVSMALDPPPFASLQKVPAPMAASQGVAERASLSADPAKAL